jgi:hypothetical protein
MAEVIEVPETVNVCTSDTLPKLVLNGNNVPDRVIEAEVGLTVLAAMALVRWRAPGLVSVTLPL